MGIEERLKMMGIELPEAPGPVAAYVPAVVAGGFLFTAGQLPFRQGQVVCQGRVGADVTPEEGYEAARLCALNCLAVARAALGGFDRLQRVVKVDGFVNSAPGFTGQPGVLNGASEFLAELMGEAGRHARAAVGVSDLPLNAAVEVAMTFQVAG